MKGGKVRRVSATGIVRDALGKGMMVRMRIVCLLLLSLVWSSADAVEIVCHRAANASAPENTRAAAQLCIDWGVDYVEVDVRTSKDGVMYILHDPTVDRTTNGHGILSQLTSSEIDALDAGSWFDPKFSGERIPRIEPYLRWIKGKAKVYFDFKAGNIQKLVALVRELDMERECFFWFDNPLTVRAFRDIAPDIPLKINAYSIAEVEQAKREFNAEIIECGLGNLSPEYVDTCRRNKIKIMVLEGGKNPEAFRKIIKWDVDMINLNHADLFIKVRDEMK